jgi:hypothetical protein
MIADWSNGLVRFRRNSDIFLTLKKKSCLIGGWGEWFSSTCEKARRRSLSWTILPLSQWYNQNAEALLVKGILDVLLPELSDRVLLIS